MVSFKLMNADSLESVVQPILSSQHPDEVEHIHEGNTTNITC